jgi:uncharacterized membrane protein YbhN (UPF0104 family)
MNPKHISRLKKVLSFLLTGALGLGIALILYHHRHDWVMLVKVRPVFLPGLLSASFGLLLLSGFVNRILVKPFGIELAWREWLALAVLSSLGNNLLPGGGMVGKGAYFAHKYHLSIPAYTALLLVNGWVQLLSALGLAFVILGLSASYGSGLVSITGMVCLLLGIVPLFLPHSLPNPSLPSGRPAFFRQLVEGIELVAGHPQTRLWIILTATVGLLALAVTLWLCGQALSIPLGIGESLIMAGFLLSARMIALTPAAFGIQEMVTAFSSNLAGGSVQTGLLVALLFRVVTTLVPILLALLFSRQIKQSLFTSAHPQDPSE